MRFDYVNVHGKEQWWLDKKPVSQAIYEVAFEREYPEPEMDMTCVGFEDMIKLISDGDKVAYFKTPYKTYKFYTEEDEEYGTVDIKIQVDDEDMDFGDFFQEYEYVSDWVNYKFVVKKAEQWIECDFKKAHSCYEAGMRVRCDLNGVVEEFNKTSRDLRHLVEVVTMRQMVCEGWEYLA